MSPWAKASDIILFVHAHYILKYSSVIGAGNFGEVRRGEWQNVTVALKGMKMEHAAELHKFKAEIKLLW